jgi:class 3 adenylate cyclase
VVSANFFMAATVCIGLAVHGINRHLRAREFLARQALRKAHQRSEDVLLSVLPQTIAEELKEGGRVRSQHIGACTILFTDFAGFTRISSSVDPGVLVQSLDETFGVFDEVTTRWGVEKLKTIGDSYMGAAGALEPNPSHLLVSILAGLELLALVETGRVRAPDGSIWQMRVGLHSGPVVAGVIGQKKLAYDLWGDTVNMASRMESLGVVGRVNMTSELYAQVADWFEGEVVGQVQLPGRGAVSIVGVSAVRPDRRAELLARLDQ